MVNWRDRTAVIQRYNSDDGCFSCGWGGLESGDGIMKKAMAGDVPFVSCEEMLRRAQLCVDPEMLLLTMQKDDIHFLPVSTLYSAF